MRSSLRKMLGVAIVAGAMTAMAGLAQAQETLNVWWVKGFYKSEDDALYAAIKKFEQKTGVKVDLSQYPVQDMIPKTVAALDSGSPPDVAYADVYDFQVTAKWAFDGKLEDISSVIDPIRGKFEPRALSTTFLFNNATQTRAYYAYPIKQQTMHIQYWKDMLADAGYKESDIPKTWKEYWNFWCEKVQTGYRQKTGQRGFAYFVLHKPHGKLLPGVYQRFDFSGLGSSVKPVKIFVRFAKYRQRLDFYGLAERTARAEFNAKFPGFMEEAVRTAK